jgi:hypothetical protein
VTSNQPETVVRRKDGLDFILTNAKELPTLL